MFKKIRHIHFVGIGGIGMSGIAEVLANLGYKISGSDLKRSPITVRLAKKGAKIFYGHRASHIEGAHVVVISSAVRPTNPEWTTAQEKGIPVVTRAEMLAELMRLKYGIAVAGSHGKTTTTSLVANVLYQAGLDPTLVIGGRVKSFRSNAKLGKGEFLVAEADESDGSFMKLSPTIAVITNIDPEHMDHYHSFEELKATFVNFANKIPFYGAVVACVDHPTVKEILPQIKKRVVTYGLTETADFYARDIQQQGLQERFEVFHRGVSLGKVTLKLAGLHNVYNALAAIAVGHELEIPFKQIVKGLGSFKGIERRMETLYKGREAWVIDDYGHHPEEIKATLSALRMAFPDRRIVTLFQPHRYTRTRDLFAEFQGAFGNTDLLLLTEVYAAGEDPIAGVSGESLALAMKKKKDETGIYFSADKETLADEAARIIRPNDVIVTLGAGDIVKVGRKIAQWLRKKEKHVSAPIH
ncbi:MAG: UDP-N-acetylmuramate--L-alanine ligase [bacterium]